MDIWRGIWSFSFHEGVAIPLTEYALTLSADYMLFSEEKVVFISKAIRTNNRDYYSNWFAAIYKLSHLLRDYISNEIITKTNQDYLEYLIQIHKSFFRNAHIRLYSSKQRLLICDLGDVIWDECPAQAHMKTIAIQTINRQGYDITEKEWDRMYYEVAQHHCGERFTQCVINLTNQRVAQRVNSVLHRDFSTMGIDEYTALHPLRDDFYDCFFDLYNTYEICFVANQPPKAYGLIEKYSIGVISPLWFLSCEIGMKKPDKKVFEYCLDFLGDKNHWKTCFMLGNRKDMDLIPASELGVLGILFFCPNSVIHEDLMSLHYKPWKIVSSFSELCQLLKAV